MTLDDSEASRARSGKDTFRLIREMKDYADVGMKLVWQRQMIFIAALALAGYYYDVRLAVETLALIAVSEAYDFWTFTEIRKWTRYERRRARQFLYKLYIGTVLSAGVIVFYAVGISIRQGPTAHFMPLFFLFAAALFAAMNNHQLLSVLILRLLFYGGAFIFIPVRDIVVTGAPIQSELWAQLFTSLFVIYFIIDCSRIYLNFYRLNQHQISTLRAEHRKTKLAFKAKSEFLSIMSHELRTPLTSIKGSVDLVTAGLLGELPEKAKAAMAIAQRNCVRLITQIDEILDLQKMDSGKMQFEFETVNLALLVENAVLENRPYAERLGVSLIASVPTRELSARADKFRLEQVLANLLSNAAKFSPPGSRVQVMLTEHDGLARILVIDEGVGLNESQHEKVFDEFSQIDASDTRKVGGTGLGMNISKRIIQAHQGVIDYKKNEGPGTTFFVDLPMLSILKVA